MSEVDPSEATACCVVSTNLDVARCEHWDRNGRDNAFDFKLYAPDAVHALEVTTAAHQDLRDHDGRWRRFGPQPSAKYPGLHGHWLVMMNQQYPTLRKRGRKRKTFNARLPEWLKLFEQYNINEAGQMSTVYMDWPSPQVRPDLPSENPEVRKAIFDSANAGIWKCSRTAGPPGEVSFSYGYASSDYELTRPAGDPNHAVREISDLLQEERHRDDAEKLDASGCDRRHLWLWVDVSRMDIVRALDEDGDPTEAPAVDPRITDLWIARALSDGAADVLQWSTDNGWAHNTQFARYSF